ncbi:MAG: phosphatase PAP2 family protein [Clostridia bacterium]|nr:phosphatase PAP2 family protein [Clostridia bacterium]
MNWKSAISYYRDLRPNNLFTKKYRHLLLLLYWPVHFGIFVVLENFAPIWYKALTGAELHYTEIVCALDAYIPFCEAFVIPYYAWFVFLAGMVFYGLLFDIRAYREYMWFVILTYFSTLIIYIIFPNMQGLRPTPEALGRDNFFVDVVRWLYSYDTNTNVCPSIHVLGTLAASVPLLRGKRFRSWLWKTFWIVSTVLICLSTVFLKQHSVLDVIFAVVLFFACYPLVYCVLCKRRAGEDEQDAAELAPVTQSPENS